QYIVTTGLLSLENLPIGYRQFSLGFSWSVGFSNIIKVEILSNAVNKLRKMTVCAYMNSCEVSSSTGYIGFDDSNTCLINKVTNTNSDTPPPSYLFSANLTDGEKATFNSPNGFSTYTSILKIPDMNLFFTVLIFFLIAMLM